MHNRIQNLLNDLVASGKERGIQVAAYVGGKLVVNAWAGVADASTCEPVTEETLFPVFSTTKGMVATIIHLLAQRGRLSYEDPISTFWPEFGVNGKNHITVRQALNHSSGLPLMPAGVTNSEVCDWDTMCSKLANMEPAWKPGTRIEYHAMTFGWILGEVARRVDGRPFPVLLKEEICQPLGISGIYSSIPDALGSKVAILEQYNVEPLPNDGKAKAVPEAVWPLHAWMNTSEARQACVPASNGIMNAHSIARHYAALLPGGVDGVALLSQERVRLGTVRQKPAQPETDDYQKDFALGWHVGGQDSVYGGETAFGHGGYGGSIGFGDPEAMLAVGVTKNRFGNDESASVIVKAIREGL